MNTPDPASPREFTEFWALRYSDKNESLYTSNINCPDHTAETLTTLFRWKIGAWLFKRMLERTVKPSFLSRIESARGLPKSVSAEDFLTQFPDGGVIYRIFWLHCWHPNRFPIYDQHVHRAMVFIQNGQIDELNAYSDREKIERYLRDYVPFFEAFSKTDLSFDPTVDGVSGRKADRALVTFGANISVPIRS
jgi:hypothetical protein